MFSGSPQGSGSLVLAAVGHVLANALISVMPPVFKSMAYELTSFPSTLPLGLAASVKTYNIPVGWEEVLPQFTRKTLKAHRHASAVTKAIFFDIFLNIDSPRSPPSTLRRRLRGQPLAVRGR